MDEDNNNDLFSIYISQSTNPSSSPMQGMKFPPASLFTPPPQKQIHNGNLNGAGDTDLWSYCKSDNLDDCIASLNQEMLIMGLASIYNQRTGKLDIVQLVNGIQEILQRHQKSSSQIEDLQSRLHRVTVDKDYAQESNIRLKQKYEALEQELAQTQELDRQNNVKLKLNAKKLRKEKDEVKRLLSVIEHRKSQYYHDLKKKEREILQFKERVTKLIADKSKERKVGMVMSSTLQRGTKSTKRGTWQTGQKKEEDMYKLVIEQHKDNEQRLILENEEMRDCLNVMQAEFVALLNEPTKTEKLEADDISKSDDNSSMASGDTCAGVTNSHFQMPFDMVSLNIEKSLKEKTKLLRQRMNQIITNQGIEEDSNKNKENQEHNGNLSMNNEKCAKENERLKKQAEHYKDIISQQEEFIQLRLNDQNLGVNSPNPMLHDSDLWDEWESLQRDKELVSMQKKHLEVERQMMRELQVKKDAQNAESIRRQFMELTPFQSNNRTFRKKSQNQRILPATPNFSPSPTTPFKSSSVNMSAVFKTPSTPSQRIQPAVPSTADLYRVLGLKTSFSDTDAACHSGKKNSLEHTAGPTKLYNSDESGEESSNKVESSENLSPRINEHKQNISKRVSQKLYKKELM